MNIRLRCAQTIYALLLGLYPRRFREAFGSEMRAVFTDRALEAAHQGNRRFLAICLSELRDFPGSLLREHRAEFMERNAMMDKQHEAGFLASVQSHFASETRGAWMDAFLAGVPYLLLIICILIPRTLNNYGLGIPEMALLFIVWAALGTVLLAVFIAWRLGWPCWSASFYGFFIPLLALAPVIALQQLLRAGPRGLEEGYTFVVMPILVALVFYFAVQRDTVKGSLALLPTLLLLWLPVMEFVPDQIDGWVQMWMVLVAVIAAVSIVRSGKPSRGVWVLLGFIVVVGLPAAYVRTYLNDVPIEHASPASVEQLFYNFIPTLFTSAGMIIGPLLARSAWQVARMGGRIESAGYSLAVLGLLLNLGGNLMAFLFFGLGESNLFGVVLADRFVNLINPSIFFGLLVTVLGAGLFSLSAYRRKALDGAIRAVLLALYPLPLPLLMIAPLLFGFRYTPASLPFGLYALSGFQAVWVYTFGSIWILVGAWLLSQFSRNEPDVCAAPQDDTGLALAHQNHAR